MLKGTVKFYNRKKGFGFITRDDGSDDLFVSASSLTSSGLATLDEGQRVSFEVEKDPKGFKAANIKVEGAAPQAAPPPSTPQESQPPAAPRLTVYCDPAKENHRAVVAALEKAGHALHLVDCATTPPPREELRRLSLLLRSNDQSLVKRYDPLFFELQLDDRFLSEAEFWTAVIEHPKLIDGPVLVSRDKARLCKTPAEAQGFFEDRAHKPAKSVSPRILAMIKGHAVPPPPEKAVTAEPVPAPMAEVPPKALASAAKKAEAAPKLKLPAKAKAAPAPKKAAAKPPKPAAKAKPAKPPAKAAAKKAKPAKKTRR